jgi:hypothetical protein
MSATRYDWRAVVARLLFSLLVVFSLYNPSGYSWWHWVTLGPGQLWVKLFVSLLLAGLHWVLWRHVVAVLRPYGVAFLSILCVSAFVALSEAGLLDRTDGDTLALVVLATLVVVLTSGLSAASILHRLTGVQHVEEIPH